MIQHRREVSKTSLTDGERKLLRMACECQRLKAEREQLKADICAIRFS